MSTCSVTLGQEVDRERGGGGRRERERKEGRGGEGRGREGREESWGQRGPAGPAPSFVSSQPRHQTCE